MRITKEEIDTVKRAADLIEVVESHGVRLKKKGQSYVGLCPFHKEKTPSFTVNPKTNLWHCFGCRAGGDVIGFICKMEGVTFKEAMEKLNGSGQRSAVSHQHRDNGRKESVSERSAIDRGRLLNRVVSFYHQSFLEDPRAREYLERRGIKDKAIFTDFKVSRFGVRSCINSLYYYSLQPRLHSTAQPSYSLQPTLSLHSLYTHTAYSLGVKSLPLTFGPSDVKSASWLGL